MPEPFLPGDTDARVRRLHQHWVEAGPATGRLPGRQHIDPASLADLLPWMWLVDVERRPLRFRYRLLGTGQVRAMNDELTGRWMDEAHPRFLASASYPDYVAAAERDQAHYRRGPATFHLDKDYVLIERLLLPLARNGIDVDMLLAITVYRNVFEAAEMRKLTLSRGWSVRETPLQRAAG